MVRNAKIYLFLFTACISCFFQCTKSEPLAPTIFIISQNGSIYSDTLLPSNTPFIISIQTNSSLNDVLKNIKITRTDSVLNTPVIKYDQYLGISAYNYIFFDTTSNMIQTQLYDISVTNSNNLESQKKILIKVR